MPVGSAGVEERKNVRMLERRRRLDLDDEPLSAEHRRKFRFENFDGDFAIVLEVVREIDGRHAAGAELALDAIAVGERGARRCGVGGQRRIHGNRRPERDIALLQGERRVSRREAAAHVQERGKRSPNMLHSARQSE